MYFWSLKTDQIRFVAHYHGVRGSVSPVLTATGFLNRKWQFSPPPLQNRHPSTDYYVSDPDSSAKLVHTSTGERQREWVKYGPFYLFIPILGTHLQVRPVDGFSRVMAQTTRNRARACLLGFVDITAYLW